MNKKYDPVEGNVLSVFFHYAIPSVISMLAISSAFMIDGIFVGNYVGADALAAVNLSMPVWSGLLAIVLMLSIGGAVMVGNFLGEGNESAAADIFSKTMACSLFFAIVTGLLGLLFIDPLIIALGATDALSSLVFSYLQVILWFSPLFLMGTALFYFVKVDGNPILASVAMIAVAAINIVLDWVFLAKMDMGIEGAAYATGIAESVALLILIPHFFRPESQLKLISISGSWRKVASAMANGFSEFANEISIGFTTLLFNWVMITRIGVDGVAAFTIINYIYFIGIIIFYGLGESLQPLVSKNLGARQAKKITTFVLAASVSTLVVALTLCTILIIYPERLISFFLKPEETETLTLAADFVYYFWPAFLFCGFNIIFTEYFTACQKPVYSASIALSRSLILPCLLLVTLPIWLEDVGIFIAIPIAEAITLLMAITFLYKNKPSQVVAAHHTLKEI